MTEETKKETIQLSVRSFPKKLNTRLKKLSVRRGTSIKSLIIEACEEMLKRKPQ